MSCGWLLALPVHVLLLLACPRLSRSALDYSFTDNSDAQPERYDKRYDDIDYDSFVGLMGRRSTGINREANLPFRPNMNDIFVGLLGRRNTLSSMRKERRANIFFKDGRLRFCCGV